MNQPPAFQFYVDNFIQGTCDMDCAEVGAYIRLLCYQWSNGSIPSEKGRVSRVAGGEVSDHVLKKFVQGQDGMLRNPRMERERIKQSEYRTKQSEFGKTGGRPKKGSLSEPFPKTKGFEKGSQSSPSPSPSPVPVPVPSPIPSPSPLQGNPNHTNFIKGWSENFKAVFGMDYKYQGRDSKAVKELLSMNILVIDLLEVAKKAWKRGMEDKFSTNCKRASTIFDFNQQFNQIQVELKRQYENNGASGSKGFDRNKGTLNEGHAERYNSKAIQKAIELRDSKQREPGENA